MDIVDKVVVVRGGLGDRSGFGPQFAEGARFVVCADLNGAVAENAVPLAQTVTMALDVASRDAINEPAWVSRMSKGYRFFQTPATPRRPSLEPEAWQQMMEVHTWCTLRHGGHPTDD